MILAEMYLFSTDERMVVRIDEKIKVSEGIYDVINSINNIYDVDSDDEKHVLCEEGIKNYGLISTRNKKMLFPDMSFAEQNVAGGDTLIFFRKEEEHVQNGGV